MTTENKHISILVALGLLWLFACYEWVSWFIGGFFRHVDLLHFLLFAGVGTLLIRHYKESFGHWDRKSFYLNPVAIVVGVLSAAVLALSKRYVDIHILSFSAALLLLYSLSSLITARASWTRALIPFALLMAALPFDRHFDILFGYPLRLMAVDLSMHVLQPILPDIGARDTLLFLENRASHVDMDCSGLKGLWVGTASFLGIAFFERSRLNLTFFAALFGLILLLVSGNIIRIILLAFSQLQEDSAVLDPMVHHSTSVFFLLLALAFSYFLLRRNGAASEALMQAAAHPKEDSTRRSRWHLLWFGLLITPIVTPAYMATTAFDKGAFRMTDEMLQANGWERQTLAVSDSLNFAREGIEAHFFIREAYQLIVVPNGDWRSQHKSEICYELQGHDIETAHTRVIAKDFSVREISFSDTADKAVYWYQNDAVTTDDFASKVWAQVTGSAPSWTQISMLSHEGALPDQTILEVRNIIQYSLYP